MENAKAISALRSGKILEDPYKAHQPNQASSSQAHDGPNEIGNKPPPEITPVVDCEEAQKNKEKEKIDNLPKTY